MVSLDIIVVYLRTGKTVGLKTEVDGFNNKSNWDRYFADKIEVDNFADKWRQLYDYRNAVAHAKRINGKEFSEASKLIDEIKKAFETSLEHVGQVNLSEDEAEAVQEVAQKTIGPATFSIQLPRVATTVSALGGAASQAASGVNYAGIGSSLLQVGNASRKVLDGIKIGTTDSLLSNLSGSHIHIDPTTGDYVLMDSDIIPKVSEGILQPFKQPTNTSGSQILSERDKSIITGSQDSKTNK